MHQLHCNGVLEGIRICRKGYPSRLVFSEFVARYGILAACRVKAKGSDLKAASAEVLDEIKMDPANYKIGLSKVLFKAGILGTLEELRDAVIEKLLRLLQSQMRRYLVKKNIKKMLEQKKSLTVLQKNLKAYLALRSWKWGLLWQNIQPLLQGAKKEEERLAREAEEARLAEVAKQEAERQAKIAAEAAAAAAARAEEERREKERKAAQAIEDLRQQAEQTEMAAKKLTLQKAELEAQLAELEGRLAEQEATSGDLGKKKRALEVEIGELKACVDEVTTRLNKAEAESKSRENQIRKLQDEMALQDDKIAKLMKEKRRVEEAGLRTGELLQQEEDKANHLGKCKAKLEALLDENEENLEREKRGRADLDKVRIEYSSAGSQNL